MLVFLLSASSYSQVRDTYPDTWVAVDELGRAVADNSTAGNPRNKVVGLFYYIWHEENIEKEIKDISKILAGQDTWGNAPNFHHYDKSLFGYYSSKDEYVIRKHVQMLSDAGVDFIFFDNSNGFNYETMQEKILNTLNTMKTQGYKVPQVCCLMSAGSAEAVNAQVESLYDNIAIKPQYQDLLFKWGGKPLLLGYYTGNRSEVANFFTIKRSWAWTSDGWFTDTQGRNRWPWMDNYPQNPGLDGNGNVEQMTVTTAQVSNGQYAIGKSTGANIQSAPVYGTDGKYFGLQWNRALQVNPPLIMITQWNEWIAQRFIKDDPTWDQPVDYMARQWLPSGGSIFYDVYTPEYSRDIEPLRTAYRDNMYLQMVNGIRKYKGVRPYQKATNAKPITINTDFSQWASVGPNYLDDQNDIFQRNHVSFGSDFTYTNTTGRNDLTSMKVSHDNTYVYFDAKTASALTAHTSARWMYLLINADADYSTGWNGYDYIVNHTVNSSTSTTIKKYAGGGFNWGSPQNIDYAYSGNELHVRVPGSIMNIDPSSGFKLDFKWADNAINSNDILDFYVDGDVAPNNRFNYRYIADDPSPDWSFTNGTEGWILANHLTGSVSGGIYNLTIAGVDPIMYSPDNLNVKASDFRFVKVKMKNNTAATASRIFFIRNDNTVWNGTKSQGFTVTANDGNYTEYIIDMTGNTEWTGTIKQIRLDPVDSSTTGTINLDHVKFSDIPGPEWNFASGSEDWVLSHSLSGSVSNGIYNLTITGADPFMHSPNNLGVNASVYKFIKVKMKNNTSATGSRIFFIRNDNTVWDGPKSQTFTVIANDGNYTEYLIDMSGNTQWTGTIKQIRLDPLDSNATGTVNLDYVKIVDTQSPKWNFTNNTEGWVLIQGLSGSVSGGIYNLAVTGADPFMHSPDNLEVNADTYKFIKVRMKNNTAATTGRIFFIRNDNVVWSGMRSQGFTINANDGVYTEYVVDMTGNTKWFGTIKQIRLDPVDSNSSGTINLDYVRFASSLKSATITTTDINATAKEENSIKCYPNPFTDKVTIQYTLSKPGQVQLAVYNVYGREVESLVDTDQKSGSYTVNWNATNQPGGIYFVKLCLNGENTETIKLVLNK